MCGVSSGQISQWVMKMSIDAEASHPTGCASSRGTGSVGTHTSSASAAISRPSRPAKWKKSTARKTANTETTNR
jgi:hypothetical protein